MTAAQSRSNRIGSLVWLYTDVESRREAPAPDMGARMMPEKVSVRAVSRRATAQPARAPGTGRDRLPRAPTARRTPPRTPLRPPRVRGRC